MAHQARPRARQEHGLSSAHTFRLFVGRRPGCVEVIDNRPGSAFDLFAPGSISVPCPAAHDQAPLVLAEPLGGHRERLLGSQLPFEANDTRNKVALPNVRFRQEYDGRRRAAQPPQVRMAGLQEIDRLASGSCYSPLGHRPGGGHGVNWPINRAGCRGSG
jgi:hypothetical protein